MTNAAMTAMTNDELDLALDRAIAEAREAEIAALFAERERRVSARRKEIAALERAWEVLVTASPEDTWGQVAARLVACPKCRAARGASCRGADGRRLADGRRSHPERTRAAGWLAVHA